MGRPIGQTREDIEILADALKRKEFWRFDLVAARVAADFGDAGMNFNIALATDREEMLDAYQWLLKDAEAKLDIP